MRNQRAQICHACRVMVPAGRGVLVNKPPHVEEANNGYGWVRHYYPGQWLVYHEGCLQKEEGHAR